MLFPKTRFLERFPVLVGIIFFLVVIAAMPVIGEDTADGLDEKDMNAFLKESITFRDKFYDASAVGNKVWMVGNNGMILHFNGNTSEFEKQDSGTLFSLFDVSFVNKQTGFIVGKKGMVFKTRNGGSSWSMIRKPHENNLLSVHFVDAMNGWAVGDYGTILHTSDGGKTWQNQSLQEHEMHLNGCFFIDENRGYIVGEFESIWETRDGGKSWEILHMEDMEGVILFNVLFKNSETGIAVGQNGVIFRTWNGGSNWERIKLDFSDNLLGIGIIDDQFTLVGMRGVFLEESDERNFKFNESSGVPEWMYFAVELKCGAAIAAGDHGRVLWSSRKNSQRKWQALN